MTVQEKLIEVTEQATIENKMLNTAIKLFSDFNGRALDQKLYDAFYAEGLCLTIKEDTIVLIYNGTTLCTTPDSDCIFTRFTKPRYYFRCTNRLLNTLCKANYKRLEIIDSGNYVLTHFDKIKSSTKLRNIIRSYEVRRILKEVFKQQKHSL